LHIPETLPIAAHAAEITALISKHQVVVVAGETGSGKTTQLPKICLAAGRKHIGHTQPRRIAARSVATRIAFELGVPLGDIVGYQVRFTNQSSIRTQLKLMTDGILLSEIATDRNLRNYDTIIIDEAHERSLNIDFLLGYLKQLLPRRPELKVIITSATIDTARFSQHFGDAPIVEIAGRSYPVAVRYRPLEPETEQSDAIVAAVKELRLVGGGVGDILVFLAGEREIREAAAALTKAKLPEVDILPLYARLSTEEQQRVFAPHPGQRIVLATNVAETSLTVPGIHYVIDPGTARISRYSARTKVQRLPIEPISRASADQRMGRCGRVAPGICIRLYSAADYDSRPAFTEPEILRTNLAAVILRMAAAKLGDIRAFPFVEAPDERQIADGLRLLDELGALSVKSRTHARLTDIGQQLARLPVDPRLGRILLEAAQRNCLTEALVLVSGLSIPDVRERPTDKRAAADALHARFASDDVFNFNTATSSPDVSPAPPAPPLRHTVHTNTHIDRTTAKPDPGGDVAALLRLWRYLHLQRARLSASAFRRLCKAEYLNYQRIREWLDLNWQLGEVARELGLVSNKRPAELNDVLTAMLSGLLGHIGLLDHPTAASTVAATKPRRVRGPREYLGARGARFAISPASLLAKHPPELVMAVELVETTRLWAHAAAEISAEQVLAVGGHLLQHSYFEPHFSSDTATVLAFRNTSLLGVPLATGVSVGYGDVNPGVARAIFIQGALVAGEWAPRPGSLAARLIERNARTRSQAAALAARERTPEVLDSELADWFAARLPADIVSGAELEKWLRAAPHHLEALRLQVDDLVSRPDEQAYPGVWTFGDGSVPIDYRFAPDTERDGATVKVPLAKLAEANPASFTWGLPGRRQELATALIRSLPKRLRTAFVPAPDFAAKALQWLEHNADATTQAQPFSDALAYALLQLTGVSVQRSDWNPEAVPAHLRLNFAVTDGDKEVAFGKDITVLQRDYAKQVSAALTTAAPRHRSGTTWVFDTLPETLTITKNGINATGYPGLRDLGDAVSEAVFDTPAFAAKQQRLAIVRLLQLGLPDPTRWVLAHLSQSELLAFSTGSYPNTAAVLHDAHLKAIAQLVAAHADPSKIRDAAAYHDLEQKVRQDQAEQTRKVVITAAQALQHAQAVSIQLGDVAPEHPAYGDIRAQLQDLLPPGFIVKVPDPWFNSLPRYLKAVLLRLEVLHTNPALDEPRMAQVDAMLSEYDDLLDTLPPGHPIPDEVRDIGWLIEEYRVQVFAQRLGTAVPVSEKRIRKAIAAFQSI
jgi:ATP-dependent helicase HrpA